MKAARAVYNWAAANLGYDHGKARKLTDPAFASAGGQSRFIMEYIGNAPNYKERFAY